MTKIPTLNIPQRTTTRSAKKMLSMRLPVELIAEIKAIAAGRGCTTTDVVHAALDQYVQWQREQNNANKEAA